MGTYAVSTTGRTNAGLVIRAGIYDIRLTLVTFSSNATSGVWLKVARYGSQSVAGTACDVASCRQGAPAASATAVTTDNNPTGTGNILWENWLPTGTGQTEYANFFAPGASAVFTPPLPLTAAAGSLFFVSPLSGNIPAVAFFEELRLQGST